MKCDITEQESIGYRLRLPLQRGFHSTLLCFALKYTSVLLGTASSSKQPCSLNYYSKVQKQGVQDRKNVVFDDEEVIETMGSEADFEQAVEIVPDTQVAHKEFSQWDIGLYAGRKTSNDEKYALLSSRWQPGKNS